MVRLGIGATLAACLALGFGCSEDRESARDEGAAGGSGDGGTPGDTGGGGSGGLPGGDGVWSDGMLPELPAEAILDGRSYFPAPEGAVWRYRRRPDDWADPGPIEQGAESVIVQAAGGDDGDEYVRETVTLFDLVRGDETQRVRQVMRETFVLSEGVADRGPEVKLLRVEIDEREVGTQRFVRTVERRYLPAYTFISDAYRVGLFDNILTSTGTRLIQTSQRRGEEEPDDDQGLIDLKVQTSADEKTVIIDGAYRSGLRKIDFYDDFTGQLVRTYWLEQGVGVVQWQSRDQDNIVFTLVESNLE